MGASRPASARELHPQQPCLRPWRPHPRAAPWQALRAGHITRPRLDDATGRHRGTPARRARPRRSPQETPNARPHPRYRPITERIPENGLTDPSPIPGLKHGKGGLGRRGWAGPRPIRSHGPHSYVFQLFALDHRPEPPDTFTLADALQAMAEHVIARARLDGTYEIQ
ncbi:hypothetical protein HKK74_31230 [Actinomadura alba]|uniref:YbhB/YbcL family Raf kinase inhibitor-like protein n=1 Tax=Actinomadura alba TaxID=406431 RepID=A0ABR7LYU6_9ACTN|nr:hypothetical protein [Actinomadura alba]